MFVFVQDMKFHSKITTEYVTIESSIMIMEPYSLLDSSGRGHETEGIGYSAQTSVGAGHASVGGYGL